MIIKERNPVIDSLRFLAALWVALFHFNEPIPYIDNWYRNLMKYGYLGVPVFFVISGFCILLTANRSGTAREFLIKRLFRIMPAYWFSLIVVLLVVINQKILTGYNSITPLPKDFISISAVLTLLTGPFSAIPTVNWVYWSLTFELFFYIIIALSLLFTPKHRLSFLLIVSFIGLSMPVVANGPLFFFKHWPAFSLGVGICQVFLTGDRMKKIAAYTLVLISIITLIKNFGFTNQAPYLFATIISAVIITLSQHLNIRKSPFSNLGAYSYTVYLINVPIGVYLLGPLNHQSIQNDMMLNISFNIVTYAIIAVLSFFIFKYVENPFIQLGKRFAQTLSNKYKRPYIESENNKYSLSISKSQNSGN